MNNTNASDHTTIAKASIASSEYHTMEAFGRGPGTQARLGVEHNLLNVFGDVIGILLCKIVSKARVSTYVLSKSNPTHGGAYKQNHA
jgi:hypothetical protein